jgi:hypothetical protein
VFCVGLCVGGGVLVWEVYLYVGVASFVVSLIGRWLDMCSEGGGRLPVGRSKYAMTVRSLGSFSSLERRAEIERLRLEFDAGIEGRQRV